MTSILQQGATMEEQANSNSSSSGSSEPALSLEAKMQAVLDLMDARASGRASNEEVEAAVARMLGDDGTAAAAAAAAASSGGSRSNSNQPAASASNSSNQQQQRKAKAQPEIQFDTENYDDDSDDGGGDENGTKKQSTSGAAAVDTTTTTTTTTTTKTSESAAAESAEQPQPPAPPPAPTTPKRRRGRPRKHPRKHEIEHMDLTPYQDVPLGPQGAQMMTTFGDGKQPHPGAVAAALRGARLLLQTAVRDARHYRRRQRRVYRAAKDSLKADKPHKPALQHEWSNEILYRAAAGYDQLAYDPKCGFRTEDLRVLFPEEMNAYERWNEMHAAAEEQQQKEAAAAAAAAAAEEENGEAASSDAKSKASAADLPPVNNSTTANNNNNAAAADDDPSSAAAVTGGHLQERAAQFDWRTDRMADRWYLTYAHLRQRGSFLPRSARGRSADETALQRQQQQPKQQPRGGWRGLSPAAVRFLHWVGFDPQSALPPPSDDTTGALAFLGYDFFGRIVEKAISLKIEQARQQKDETGGDDSDELLVELPEGEQLDAADIERALEDPDIKPAPIFASSSDKTTTAGGGAPLLYFGPGFENRLELELDEMLQQPCEMSPEERQIRQEEDAVFARLAEPPPTGAAGGADNGADEDNNDGKDDSDVQNDDSPKKKASSKRTAKRRRKS